MTTKVPADPSLKVVPKPHRIVAMPVSQITQYDLVHALLLDVRVKQAREELREALEQRNTMWRRLQMLLGQGAQTEPGPHRARIVTTSRLVMY